MTMTRTSKTILFLPQTTTPLIQTVVEVEVVTVGEGAVVVPPAAVVVVMEVVLLSDPFCPR